jgi:hypothetical protein
MGAYKGRVNLKQRRSRFAKTKRIKAATRSEPPRKPAASNKATSPQGKSSKPDDDDLDTEDLALDKTEGGEAAVGEK